MTVLDIYKPHSQRERACVGVCDEPKKNKTHGLGHAGNRNANARLNEVASSNTVPYDPATL